MKLDVTTQKGYDIACALRGPDAPPGTSWRLKYLLTAYIRFLAGIEGSTEATVRQAMLTEEEARLALQEATNWKAQNYNSYWHYLFHIETAAVALGNAPGLVRLASTMRDPNQMPTVTDILQLGGGDEREG